MPDAKFSVTWDRNCQVGKPWKVKFLGVAAYKSIVVDFYGCTGGIYRYFPRDRDQMEVWFRFSSHGNANMIVFGRDLFGKTIDGAFCKIEIAPQSRTFPDPTSKNDDDDWHHQLSASVSTSQDDWSHEIERTSGSASTVLPQHGKPPMAETWCPSAGPSGYGINLNALPTASPPSQRPLDFSETLRQQVEARLMKRFDKS
jgi:hypothetical protein